MEVDSNPTFSSSSITPTAWFEFLLDETLLEKHLKNPDSGVLFLKN